MFLLKYFRVTELDQFHTIYFKNSKNIHIHYIIRQKNEENFALRIVIYYIHFCIFHLDSVEYITKFHQLEFKKFVFYLFLKVLFTVLQPLPIGCSCLFKVIAVLILLKLLRSRLRTISCKACLSGI